MITQDEIIHQFPSPIAFHYARAVDEQTAWLDRTVACNRLFDFGIRALVLGILSRYARDQGERFYNETLSRSLHDLNKYELDYWIHLLRTFMEAYQGDPERFFMEELYSNYWEKKSPTVEELIAEILKSAGTVPQK